VCCGGSESGNAGGVWCCFSCLCRGAGFCLFFNGVAAGEEDGELRKNDDGVGDAGVFVMENGSGSQLGRKRRWPPTGVLPLF